MKLGCLDKAQENLEQAGLLKPKKYESFYLLAKLYQYKDDF